MTYKLSVSPAVSDKKRKLSWLKPAGYGDGGYRVRRAQYTRDSAGVGSIGAYSDRGKLLGSGIRSFEDTTEPNREYRYLLRAYSKDRKSYRASVTRIVRTTPARPSKITVKRSGTTNTVSLEWKDTRARLYSVELQYRTTAGRTGWSSWSTIRTFYRSSYNPVGGTSVWSDRKLEYAHTGRVASANHQYRVRVRVEREDSRYATPIKLSSAWRDSAILRGPEPVKPTSVAVERISDKTHKVTWNASASTDKLRVERSVWYKHTDGTIKWGKWRALKTLAGTARSYTDRTTKADRGYRYRIVAVGTLGTDPARSDPSIIVRTTPKAPIRVRANRSGDRIIVQWLKQTVFSDPDYLVQARSNGGTWQDMATITNGAFMWAHNNADPLVVWEYRVRTRVPRIQATSTMIMSAWSAVSNKVTLLTPPAAPTKMVPDGAVVPTETPVKFSWQHNSLDTSAQSGARLRIRAKGTTAWSSNINVGVGGDIGENNFYTPTAYTWNLIQDLLDDADTRTLEWQVGTRGDHALFGEWSKTAVVTILDTPQVVIAFPEDPIFQAARMTVEWEFWQGQDYPQTAWQVDVLDDTGAAIERRQGKGTRSSLKLQTVFRDQQEYYIVVSAACQGVWSEAAMSAITTQFDPGLPPFSDIEWDEETGSVLISVSAGEALSLPSPAWVNLATNPRFQAGTSTATVWGASGKPLDLFAEDVGEDETALYRVAASTPAKPTAATVSSWVEIPPTYVAGQRLYRSIRTEEDEEFTYSAVKLLSSTGVEVTGVRGITRGYAEAPDTLVVLPGTEATINRALAGETLLVTAVGNNQYLKIGTDEYGAEDGTETRVVDATGTVKLGPGRWTNLGIFAGEYDGPYFDGDMGTVISDDGLYTTAWVGNPDNSTSKIGLHTPVTKTIGVERSADGEFWEPVAEDLGREGTVQDWECKSWGETFYRVTGYTAIGAATASITSIIVRSEAGWLGGGEQYSQVARLPFNPRLALSGGRARSAEHYEGREYAVAYSGDNISRTWTAGGSLAVGEEDNATRELLTDVMFERLPVHLWRDPEGNRVYVSASKFDLSRENHMIWDWTATLEEVENPYAVAFTQ